MRIVFVQYGDYRAASLNFAAGGAETYAAQRYSVDFVADLAREHEQVSVLSVSCDPYPAQVTNGVHVQGMRLYSEVSVKDLVKRVAALRPTHLIARSPIDHLLRWGVQSGVRTFPLIATSFPKVRKVTTRFRYWQTARILSNPAIDVIGDHALNSCLDLKRIGVPPTKIVPWDWPAMATPNEREPKQRRTDGGPVRLFFAGVISEDKGVGDCLNALRVLRQRGHDARFTFAGAGKVDEFKAVARKLSVDQAVTFLGRIPHQEVLKHMHEHDVTVVPSRHSYPEGLPLTIYDSYCSRTPLVASDHPMFRGRVEDRFAALVFRASQPQSLADRVDELLRSPELYARLSQNSAAAWSKLQLPVRWGELLKQWLAGPAEIRKIRRGLQPRVGSIRRGRRLTRRFTGRLRSLLRGE